MIATLKYRDVLNDAIKLMLFPYSLEGAARVWYEKEPPNSILTWDDLVNKFVNQFFPPSKTTHLKNKISHFTQRFEETFSEAWDRFKELLRACPHHGFSKLTQIDTFYNGLTEQDQDSLNAASGGNLFNKTTREALKIIENKSKVRYSRSKSNVSRVNTNSRDVVSKPDDRINKLADQISNLVEIVNKQGIAPAKAVEKTCVTCEGPHAYYDCIATDRPSISTESPLEKVDEQNTEEILDKEHSNISGSTAQIQPPVVPISISKPDVPRTQTKPTIPYPSRLNDQKLREKATNQMEKFFQIFHDLHFDISFADALLLMPKFASTIKNLLANKDNFLKMNVCHALADLGASINLIPLSIWKKISLPELTPTRITLELADRSITRPKGVTEDVFVKVWKFHFPTDFVVVDFEADTRVPLILERSFLRTGRALIDVYGEEITLRVNDESVTFNLDQVVKYYDNSVSRVNVINIASEEVVQDNSKSSNPTLVSESDFCEDPIVKTSPFRESDFFSEEIKNFLKDDSIPIENFVFDPKGDILLIEKLLNEDPCQLPPINLNQAKSPIKETEYSFSMGYEHFSTTLVTELDEVAESIVKKLVPIPRDDDFTSNDNESIHDEDVPIEESKVYLNPLFDDDEINSDELESHCLNVKSNFIESLSNHDTVKFDHLEEFSGALMPIRIAKEERIRKEHAKYISLMERLITINPCPRPMENANTIVESLPSSLIPVQDNDSQREEIDIVTDTDELLPPGFENDDSEGEIDVLEELRVDNSIHNSKNELSYNEASDHDNPSFPRPPPEPPDAEFDLEPDSGEVISAVMNTIDELNKDDPGEEFDISTNNEDDDYFPFMFVI
nr:reverse transcriptase domain-containing protein [Tanacetum cinerariifolium]